MNATNGGTVVRVTTLALRIGPEALIGQQVIGIYLYFVFLYNLFEYFFFLL